MPISRNTSQSKKSLKEFYGEFLLSGQNFGEKNDFYIQMGKAMIQLLKMLNKAFVKTQLWGLTSLACLIIQEYDDWQSKRHVVIWFDIDGTYKIQFATFKSQRFNMMNTIIKEARSIEEAIKYVSITMYESEGWKGNEEINSLMKRD